MATGTTTGGRVYDCAFPNRHQTERYVPCQNCKVVTTTKATATENPLVALVAVLNNAERELAEHDGYDLCQPLAVRVAINSLLVGFGESPKDLEGSVGSEVDDVLAERAALIVRAINRDAAFDAMVEALQRALKFSDTKYQSADESDLCDEMRAALAQADGSRDRCADSSDGLSPDQVASLTEQIAR